MIQITGLFVYPVKSLGGIKLKEAELAARGIKYDREWLIVDEQNSFITQREIAKMALIASEIDEQGGNLLLKIHRGETLAIPLAPQEGGETIKVKVWSDSAKATVESDETNTALSNFLGKNVRLVRMAKDYRRRVDGRYAPGKDNIVGFADAFPLLIISDESLDDLNDRLEYPVLMNRFRPNITARGGGAFAEDKWDKVHVNGIDISIVKPCDRCNITTIDQEAAVPGKEPLRTLANYRKKNGKVLFGQNAVFSGPGKLKIGDEIKVLEEKI